MFVPFYAYFSLTLTYFFMRKQSFPTSLEFFKFKALYNYSPELPLFPDLRYRSYRFSDQTIIYRSNHIRAGHEFERILALNSIFIICIHRQTSVSVKCQIIFRIYSCLRLIVYTKNQAFAASSDSKRLVLICAPQGRSRFYFYFAQRSFTTSPAIISPTTDGTNATLPGISLLSVHLCFAPGGQIQWFLQLIAMSSIGLVGFSSE